jgi:cob(I)alamin adenosyltransferase
MVRISKVYTKKGDQGMTELAGGQKVSKSSARIEAYGGVDEINSAIGLVFESVRHHKKFYKFRKQLQRIQNELFNLGSQLAVLPKDRRKDTPIIIKENIQQLEKEMDEMNKKLPHLTSFILPGGGETSARLHLARTICRRVERNTIRLADGEPLDGTEIPYLNRLSDWLFVAARHISKKEKIEETLWK